MISNLACHLLSQLYRGPHRCRMPAGVTAPLGCIDDASETKQLTNTGPDGERGFSKDVRYLVRCAIAFLQHFQNSIAQRGIARFRRCGRLLACAGALESWRGRIPTCIRHERALHGLEKVGSVGLIYHRSGRFDSHTSRGPRRAVRVFGRSSPKNWRKKVRLRSRRAWRSQDLRSMSRKASGTWESVRVGVRRRMVIFCVFVLKRCAPLCRVLQRRTARQAGNTTTPALAPNWFRPLLLWR